MGGAALFSDAVWFCFRAICGAVVECGAMVVGGVRGWWPSVKVSQSVLRNVVPLGSVRFGKRQRQKEDKAKEISDTLLAVRHVNLDECIKQNRLTRLPNVTLSRFLHPLRMAFSSRWQALTAARMHLYHSTPRYREPDSTRPLESRELNFGDFKGSLVQFSPRRADREP